MKVHVLGTRGEIEPSTPYHSHQSGVLIDEKILFDIGEEEFLSYSPEYIFITHLHPDHAFFVRNTYTKKIDFSIPVYAPERSDGNPAIVSVKNKTTIGSYIIHSIPSHHSKKVESCSYLIIKNNQSILYTGDLIWINKQYHHLFGHIDLVITEASFIRKNGRVKRDRKTGQIYGHAGVPRLISLFKDYTDHILFLHFGEWFYKDVKQARKKLTQLGKKNNVNVLVGYDGLEIEADHLS